MLLTEAGGFQVKAASVLSGKDIMGGVRAVAEQTYPPGLYVTKNTVTGGGIKQTRNSHASVRGVGSGVVTYKGVSPQEHLSLHLKQLSMFSLQAGLHLTD